MNLELERFLDGIDFTGRLALDGSVQRYGRKGNQWVWSLEKGGNAYVVAGDWSTGERTQFGKKTLGIQRVMRELRDSKAEQHATAAADARKTWESLDSKPTGRTYLERKSITGFGVRFRGPNVYIPMERGGEIVGLQRISPTGEKRFTAGCSKRGASLRIGLPGPAVLCEGYATGMSIHMATCRPVVVAFDCGNLAHAAEWHALSHIAADHDLTEGNPGLTHAQRVAETWEVPVVVPPPGMDWNDVHVSQGLDAVRKAFPW